MAQTRTRASARRSPSRRNSQSSQRPRSRSTQSRSRAASASRSSNGRARIEAARRTLESSTKEAGQSVGKAASKAKTPLLAGGAALAGAAGGMAIGAMRSNRSHPHKILGIKMPQPKRGIKMPQPKRVKIRSRDVASATRELGAFGQHVGELATELRHAREDAGAGGKHRSPVEVVLDGLTARR